jgi:hypothetical protein
MKTVSEYADKVCELIAKDVGAGIVPLGKVATFADLHDYVDANDYLAQAGVPFGTDPGAGHDGTETVNAVCEEVARRINGEFRWPPVS